MNINEIKDERIRETQARFATVLDRIKQGEKQIMSEADAILAAGEAIADEVYFEKFNEFKPSPTENNFGSTSTPKSLVNNWIEERYIGDDNTVSIEFLELGLYAKRPVGRVTGGVGPGTGFLIGNNLMMTAAHVVPHLTTAGAQSFELDVEENLYGETLQPKIYPLDPKAFFWTLPNLDVVIIGLSTWNENLPPLETFGWHNLNPARLQADPADPVNIIQHPKGRSKRLAAHNSRFMTVSEDRDDKKICWYTGDTFGGSSGSPVFNLNWEVVALHHQAVAQTDGEGNLLRKNGEFASNMEDPDLVFIANQGVLTSIIYNTVANTACENQLQERKRRELLETWNQPGADARALGARMNVK